MTPFEKWCVWVTTLLTGLTGIVLGWMEYLMEPVSPWAAVNHPLQPIVLKLHILAAPSLVFALGLIALRHVWRHFRTRMPWGRLSGLTTAMLVVPMIVTGYLIQVLTHPGWVLAMALAHLGAGLVYIGGLAVHRRVINRGLPPLLCEREESQRSNRDLRAERLKGAPAAGLQRARERRRAPRPVSGESAPPNSAT